MTERISFSIQSTGNIQQDKANIANAVRELGLTSGNSSRIGNTWYVTGFRPTTKEVPPPIDNMNGRLNDFFKKVCR